MLNLINELVVSIHGVESRGQWQIQITPELSGIEGFVHDPHLYGRFPFWKILFKRSRQKEIDKFYDRLNRFSEHYPNVRPSIIAHSFGTYIVSQAIINYEAIHIDKLILCGSIINHEYGWQKLFDDERIRRVRNEVAKKDKVVALFNWKLMRRLVPNAGTSGIKPFKNDISNFEEQVFQGYTHSSHFIANMHCRVFWLPFLRGTTDFRNLCNLCMSSDADKQQKALSEFDERYKSAIKGAIRFAFTNRRVTKRQLDDYFKIIHRDIVQEGAIGKRTFEELLRIFTFTLKTNVA